MSGRFADGGGEGTVWLTPTTVLTLAGIALVLLLIVAFVVWRVVRRVRRSGLLERGLLMARAQGLASGPGRDIAALRLRLDAGIQATTQALTRSTAEMPASDLAGVLDGLRREAATVDDDLRLLEHDPDQARQREGLRVYRYEVDELLTAAGRVRDAVSRTATMNRNAELRALTAQVDEQVSTLEQYRRAYRELGGA